MNTRQLFLQHNAQTSDAPLCIEVVKAQGCKLYGPHGKEYIDLIGGISVCNVGHGNEYVIKAIHDQSEKYLHIMVYGELLQSPQIEFAALLAKHLPDSLSSIYFTNSGTEATEGAMKLAKRITKRSKIISFKNSYHGSTQGALSVMGSEYWQQSYRPLLPNIYQFEYGSIEAINAIDTDTACVLLELVQSEAGVIIPTMEWLQSLKVKCEEMKCLLIVDEIQTGFGRTGSLFRFEKCGIIPDILLLGKALGGGMPMGAFISSLENMNHLTHNPVLGHITTFGGHPVCCAAGMAAFRFLMQENLCEVVSNKESLFIKLLKHPKIKHVNSCGLLIAVHFENFETNKKIIDEAIAQGVFTDWFLFASNALRIAPPLTITLDEIKTSCDILLSVIDMCTTDNDR